MAGREGAMVRRRRRRHMLHTVGVGTFGTVVVVIGCLGVIVAMFRRRLPLNVDEMRDLRG